MVSISNWLTLGLIGGGILAFYKLGGASGIGSKIGGGFSNLYDSFTKALNPLSEATERLSENIQNPALNPILVAQERLLELLTTDPNLAEGRYVEPASITTETVASARPQVFPPSGSTVSNAATKVNTGGFIQQKTTSVQPTSWKSSSLSGVSITGSYSSSSGYSGGSTDSSTGTSNAGVTGGSTGGSTGGTQPSSRRGTYTGGRR